MTNQEFNKNIVNGNIYAKTVNVGDNHNDGNGKENANWPKYIFILALLTFLFGSNHLGNENATNKNQEKTQKESNDFAPIFSDISDISDSTSVILLPILNLKGGKSNLHQVVNNQLSEVNEKYKSNVRVEYCDSLEVFNFSKTKLKSFLKKNNADVVAWGEFLEKNNGNNDIYSLNYFSRTYEDYTYLNSISNAKGNYVEISPNELLEGKLTGGIVELVLSLDILQKISLYKFDEAIQQIKNVESQFDSNSFLLFQKAYSYHYLGRYNDAHEIYNKLLKDTLRLSTSEEISLYNRAGLVLNDLERNQEAIGYLEKSIDIIDNKLFPKLYSTVLGNLADLLESDKQYEKSRSVYKRVFKFIETCDSIVFENYPIYLSSFSLKLFGSGDLEKPFELSRKAINYIQNNKLSIVQPYFSVYYNYAFFLQQRGYKKEAVKVWEQILSSYDLNKADNCLWYVKIYLELYFTCVDLRQFEKGADYLNLADNLYLNCSKENRQTNTLYYEAHGRSKFYAGNIKESLKYYNLALNEAGNAKFKEQIGVIILFIKSMEKVERNIAFNNIAFSIRNEIN